MVLLNKEKILDYLRLGRAHTYPADWLLVIIPFMYGGWNIFQVLILSVMMFGVHWSGFGENVVLDFTQGYDSIDPSKVHHPLSKGSISIHNASNAVHWMKALIGSFAVILVFLWSPSPVLAMAALMLWFVWGTAYNVGLSKESPLGFLPIVLCFVFMAAWGWFMSHPLLLPIGLAYLIYAGSVILFQTGWSGHLKDIEQREPSNILCRLGAHIKTSDLNHVSFEVGNDHIVKAEDKTFQMFYPGKALYLGLAMKSFGILALGYLAVLAIGLPLDLGNLYSLSLIAWTMLIIVGMFVSMMLLLPQREWIKSKELKSMSIMEIFSIFAPVPLLVPWPEAIILMAFAIGYFYLGNKKLWGVAYPKV